MLRWMGLASADTVYKFLGLMEGCGDKGRDLAKAEEFSLGSMACPTLWYRCPRRQTFSIERRFSAALCAIDVFVSVSSIAHPANLLAVSADGRQPSKTARAVDGIEIDGLSPGLVFVLAL